MPLVAPDNAQVGPTLRGALAPGGGGVKIRMTLESAEPKGKKARWQMAKPRLGLAGGVLFKANCQGVPIITQPRKEHKIKEHNTGMTETRAARVEQNTRHKAEPSTLYQVYRCIKVNKRYCDIPTINMLQQRTNSDLHLRLTTL